MSSDKKGVQTCRTQVPRILAQNRVSLDVCIEMSHWRHSYTRAVGFSIMIPGDCLGRMTDEPEVTP